MTVLPEDRVTHTETIALFKKLSAAEARISDPLDDIRAIADKIMSWKQGSGPKKRDLEE